MKSLSNTFIAAIFAVVLTGLVAVLFKIPFLATKEAQTSDELMTLRYHLLEGKAGAKPDSHLVLAAIDEESLKIFGAWPFKRTVHGQFLQVLSGEKPKTVGWDIFFTEAHDADAKPAPAPVADTAMAPPPTPDQPTTTGTAATTGTTVGPDTSTTISAAVTAPGTAPSAAPDTSVAVPAAASAPGAPPPAAPAPVLSEGQQDDQALVDGASLFPTMVTAADRSDDGSGPLKDEDLLPTRPLTHITGNINNLLSAPSAELPFPALRKETFFGFVDQTAENAGGVRRTVPLMVNIDGKILPSFDLQVLMQYWGIDPDKVVVNLGHEITVTRADGTVARIPIDERGQLLINYRAHAEDFQGMGYAQMGEGLAMKQGLIDKPTDQDKLARDHLPAVKDNIVIVGVTFSGTDAGPTPLDPVAPLVSTHLNALNTILQNDYVVPMNPWLGIALYALLLFGVGNLMLRLGVAPMVGVALVTMLVLAIFSFGALYFGNLQAPLFLPEIGLLLLTILVPSKGFFGEEREKKRVKAAMGAYLSEKVMNKILAHPDNVKLGGVKQIITIMFCDIRGFTAYCDNRDSQEVLTVLNEYMEEMTQVVFKYDGTVDKYIGDCIMAFWNAPDPQADHAQRAVCCAMEMRYALANFKTKRAGKDTELFECGIGIHTGEALVGNMGSSLKVNYTAMGSTVNLGARLEALTKRLNERILISEDTRNLLEGDFPLTDRGEAMVPGFAKAIHVYAIGADQDISSALSVGRTIATQQDYTAEEVTKPIWEPAPLPSDAEPGP